MFTLSLITNKKSILPSQPIGLIGPKSGGRSIVVSAAAVSPVLSTKPVLVSPLVVVVLPVEELVLPVDVSTGGAPGPPNEDMLPSPGAQARNAASRAVGRARKSAELTRTPPRVTTGRISAGKPCS